ncbi:MAG: homoserine O-succinyltransferase [Oscillibacter sp.]|nr:homoserine O-succinyltransferase [Oscillibacter sp.]
MPIIIPPDLPAANALQRENIFYYHTPRALSQDIRMLHILLLNLMPTKIATETQFARLLGNTPIQVEVELMSLDSHTSKNTPQEHMITFYKTFEQVKHRNFDGLIITGAPIEQIEFEEADYWEELCRIMEWSKSHVQSTLHICWGAQAGLYYHYGIPKIPLPEKLFGVFEHRVTHTGSILFRGFDDVFRVPHSRYTQTPREAVAAEPRLKILAESDRAGVYAVSTEGGRQIFITGHAEYDTNTLEDEYLRDRRAGKSTRLPENYYPNDDDTKRPLNTWRSSANMLLSNWLNYFVYQEAPYDITAIDPIQLS